MIDWHNVVAERRLGRFKVDGGTIIHRPEYVVAAQTDILIVDCAIDSWQDLSTLTAFSPEFEPVERGQVIPTYRAVMESDDKGVRRTEWVRE